MSNPEIEINEVLQRFSHSLTQTPIVVETIENHPKGKLILMSLHRVVELLYEDTPDWVEIIFHLTILRETVPQIIEQDAYSIVRLFHLCLPDWSVKI